MSDPTIPAEERNLWPLWLIVGLVVGLLAGVGAGYAAFHKTSTTPIATKPTPTPGFTPTATVSASATATATPTPAPGTPPPTTAPTPPPAAGHVGLTDCPAPESGQHPLGSPGGPSPGMTADPTLDWTGCGTVTVPVGTTRFMTNDNWDLGTAYTCPNSLDYGPGGMGPSVVVTEILPGGATGPDTFTGQGPWGESGGQLMNNGGNYQLRITSPDPRCRWHFAAYTT
jgi:hypothetical protein